MRKKIVFLTGTRADFGKLKSLMHICHNDPYLEVFIFATGMHLNSKYGYTVQEIIKENFTNIFQFINHDDINHMDKVLARTIDGFSQYIKEIKPDMIIVHGDRLEALAGAIVGAFNNILVSHIEGGEISGTIDESIRHAISKLCHLHFVANKKAKDRLSQMGENLNNIFIIGSPDLDIILNNSIKIDDVKKYYDIEFDKFAISIFHPVTTEFNLIEKQCVDYCKALVDSNKNYIVIYPNNDYGSDIILNNINKYFNNRRFKIFPSLRFEYFSILLKNAEFIIGNSSTGVREALYYPIKTINVGSRQSGRTIDTSIINIDITYEKILQTINNIETFNIQSKIIDPQYGTGNSRKLFLNIIKNNNIWNTNIQKYFYKVT